MVISHKYRYVFLALPRTASRAISHELVDNYAGERILNAHATYRDFLGKANEEEQGYQVIIGIRNPLDSVASAYFKYRTAHHDIYRNPRINKVGFLRKYVRYFTDNRRFRYVVENDASFDDFFLKFYRFPYVDWSLLDKARIDHVIRYESIQDDFASVLARIDIKQVRPLPMRNKTEKANNKFLEVYKRPETIQRAKYVFGPYMDVWDYDFPEEWSKYREFWLSEAMFPFVVGGYGFYCKYLR